MEVTEFLVNKHRLDLFENRNDRCRNAFLFSTGGKFDVIEKMKFFIKQNPDVLNTVDSYNYNALHLLAKVGDLEGTQFLVDEHGRDIFDNSNSQGRNAFLLSAEGRSSLTEPGNPKENN